MTITYCGWDTPPSEPIEGVRCFADQSPAVRGVDAWVVQAIQSGEKNNLLNLCTRRPLKVREFSHSKPGGRFLWARMLNPSGQPVDWRDDERWIVIANKLRVLGEVSINLGCEGLLLDLEAYKGSPPLFQSQGDFETECQFARRQASRIEPYVPLAFHRLLSFLVDLIPQSGMSPRVDLRSHKYGLLPAFIQGLLDNSHDLTDFCGTNIPKTVEEVHQQHAGIRNVLPGLVGVDYRTVAIGQTVYLNQHRNGTFLPILQAYHECAGEPGVLLYGEAGRLCEPNSSIHAPPPGSYPMWPAVVPNFSDVLERVSHPSEFALAKTSVEPNIAGVWRHNQDKNAATAPIGELGIKGRGFGWLHQSIPVNAGESFAFSAVSSARNSWQGARWLTAKNKWIDERKYSRRFTPDAAGQCAGVAICPPSGAQLVTTLAVVHESEGDVTTFSSPRVCRI